MCRKITIRHFYNIMIMKEILNVWPDPDFHPVSHKDSAGEL